MMQFKGMSCLFLLSQILIEIPISTNSVDPDQTPRADLGLHCLSTFLLWDAKHKREYQGPVVQSVVSLTSSLRVISLTVLADSIYNMLIFFAEKM